MAKLQLSRRKGSRIFRKAAAGAPGQDARNRLTKARIWPSFSRVGGRDPGSSGMAAAGAPGQDARNRLTKAANMAKLQLSRRKRSRSSGRRSRSTRARCQEPADKGHEYGQASAVLAEGIQDLQEGAAGAPGQDTGAGYGKNLKR
ncbi:hypothetical protein ACT1WM_20815 [Bacillus stercoris]|uniref:hypothetical protein n=1 Tax=Bacillus stercoris TaxID=2054641 RepID=UPI00402AA1D8